MIILIAPELDIPKEITILNQLFEAGLACYHLRKPHLNYEKHCQYLNQIDSKFHDKIVVHFYHELTNKFNLKGIHFQEQKRIDTPPLDIQLFKKNRNLSVSSSFHNPNEIEACPIDFNYHFLSPVFSSISKKGYQGKEFAVTHIQKKIIGMGGVTKDNLYEFKKMGYHGVGVLGSIWNCNSPLEDFKSMQNFYKN